MKIEDIKQRLATQPADARKAMNEALRIAPHELDCINEGRNVNPEVVEKLSDWFMGNYAQTYKQDGYTVAKLEGGAAQPPAARPAQFKRPSGQYDPTTGNPITVGKVVTTPNKSKPKLSLFGTKQQVETLNLPQNPSTLGPNAKLEANGLAHSLSRSYQ